MRTLSRRTLLLMPCLLPALALPTLAWEQEAEVLEREIGFPSDGLEIRGTYVRPEGTGPFPVVVILHGIGGRRHGPAIRGTQDRLFREIAHRWAARGIATLRFSTGGREGSAGDYADMTLERRVREAVAAIDFLAGSEDIGPQRVSLLGHSQGSLVAAATARRLGSARPVSSVVLWAPQENAFDVYIRSMGQATYEKGLNAGPHEIVEWHGAGGRRRGFRRGFFAGLADFDAVADIRAYGGKTLVVTGRRDRWSPTYRATVFRKAGPEVDLVEFDVGHRMGADIGLDAVRGVSDATLDWLLASWR